MCLIQLSDVKANVFVRKFIYISSCPVSWIVHFCPFIYLPNSINIYVTMFNLNCPFSFSYLSLSLSLYFSLSLSLSLSLDR